MPWINSLNLRQNQNTNWVNVLRHLNLIKVESTYLLGLILSLRTMGLYPN